MNDKEYILNEVQSIFALLNDDEFPEAHGFLAQVLAEDDPDISPYGIVEVLLNCDKPKDLPEYLIDFITDMLEEEISGGNHDAMNTLGAQYYGGYRGFEQSFDKAVHYYKMAAAHGNLRAYENLGYCYYYGRTGEPDYEKAYQYFALGAFCGDLTSLYKIGDMYLNGYSVEKNEKDAFNIYMNVLNKMTDENAPEVAGPLYLRLGKMFLYGIGTEKKFKTALVCYQKAESFLFDMIEAGEYMYKSSLKAAIDGQAKARAALTSSLSEKEWKFD